MTDPFQNVDAAGEAFVDRIATTLQVRADEPVMTAILMGYLDKLRFGPDSLTVEIGAGNGAIARTIAKAAAPGQVIGTDLSEGLIRAGQAMENPPNLTLEVADGAGLRFADQSLDNVIMHTVLTHVPAPEVLLDEAVRVLKPGGQLAICDADFAKTFISAEEHDPLQACVDAFLTGYVTDRFIAGKLRGLARAAGLEIAHFEVTARPITEGAGARNWIYLGSMDMQRRGVISAALQEALMAEYDRRDAEGSLFAFQPFVSLVARKPG